MYRFQPHPIASHGLLSRSEEEEHAEPRDNRGPRCPSYKRLEICGDELRLVAKAAIMKDVPVVLRIRIFGQVGDTPHQLQNRER